MDGITDSMDMSLGELRELVMDWDDPEGWNGEEGGGFRMGNICIPVADSFWYLAKLIQLCKGMEHMGLYRGFQNTFSHLSLTSFSRGQTGLILSAPFYRGKNDDSART